MKARSKQPSVTESPHPRRQANVEAVAATLDKPEIRDPTFRDLCLRRDGNCCVATGQMDTDYWETIGCPDHIYFGPTEDAHIIPFSYASWDKSSVVYPRCMETHILTNARSHQMIAQVHGRCSGAISLVFDKRDYESIRSTACQME